MHSGVQGIKGTGKQAACTSHRWVQDTGILSRLVAHPFIVNPEATESDSQEPHFGKCQPGVQTSTVWAKGHMAYICSLLPTSTAMDTGKIKAQLRTMAAGHLV